MKMRFVFIGSLVLAAVGAWLIASPWAIGYAASATFPRWNNVVAGILAVIFGLWSAAWRKPDRPLWPTLRQAAPTLAIVALGVYLWVMVFAVYYTEVGRFNAFYQYCVSVAFAILGMAVTASRMRQAQQPSELDHGELRRRLRESGYPSAAGPA